MSKVVRLSDYTEELMRKYNKIIDTTLKKYDFDAKALIRDDNQIIQAALLRAIRANEEKSE